MIFIRFWIAMTIIGLAAAVVVLVWAFKRRQFKESDRAGFLALSGVTDDPPATKATGNTAVLLGIFGVGIIVMIASVVLSVVFVQ